MSGAAEAMLQNDWEHCPAAAPGRHKPRQGAGCGWKGRTAAIATLLRFHVVHHNSPLATLLKLAEDLMPSMLSDSDYAGEFVTLLLATFCCSGNETVFFQQKQD